MTLKVLATGIDGLLLIKSPVFEDERGFFVESFHAEKFREVGVRCNFVQDNFSCSKQEVLRGIHFQRPPYEQDKLVRVTSGRVWDVAVDLRKESQTFGRYFGVELTAQNGLSFFIPKGFGHGFCVLSETAGFHYKCSAYFKPEADGGIRWDDPSLKIPWPLKNPVVSAKDKALPFFDPNLLTRP